MFQQLPWWLVGYSQSVHYTVNILAGICCQHLPFFMQERPSGQSQREGLWHQPTRQ
jgi:hypothetical protein